MESFIERLGDILLFSLAVGLCVCIIEAVVAFFRGFFRELFGTPLKKRDRND